MVVAGGSDWRADAGGSAGRPRRGDERDLLSGRQTAAVAGRAVRAPARFRQEPDRRQDVVECHRPEREARRAHARGAGRHADRRTDPAHQGQAQAAAAAERSVGRAGAGLPEHRHRQRYRSRSAADPAPLAARWRPLCRHRRRGHHPRSRQRLSQYRHLPDDAAEQVAGRALSVARQGRAPAHHARLAAGQADPRRRRLGHRSAVHAGRLADLSQERVGIRICRRHQGPADSGGARQDHRSADPGQRGTGDRRHHPSEFGEVGRTVRRIPRLLRTAGSRLSAGRRHRGALSHAADPDQRADGGLSVLRTERLLLGHSLGQDLGRSRQARHPRHRTASIRIRRRPAVSA